MSAARHPGPLTAALPTAGRLARGACGVCGRDVALRRNGTAREHRPGSDVCGCSHLEHAHSRFRRHCLSCSCSVFAPSTATCLGSGQPARTPSTSTGPQTGSGATQ